jgi:hypothetical protein
MPVDLIGLGLRVVGAISLVMGLGFWGGVVPRIIGVVCLVGGISALFMTYEPRRRVV